MSQNYSQNDLKNEIFATEEKKLIKWICDYQQNTGLNKPLRHVKPTKVQAVANPEYLEKMKTVRENDISYYYIKPFSMYVFNKKDQVTAKEIKFTGSHGYDTGVYVFDNEKECNDKYNDLIWDQIKYLQRERERIIANLDNQIEQMKEMFVGGTDIVLEALSRNE